MKYPLRIGSRSSPLALIQVEEVIDELKKNGVEIEATRVRFTTQGDRDKSTSLTANPGDNFFTDSLDQALLNNEIDIAVHSAKDLPKRLHPKLSIFALTQGLDPRDVFSGRCPLADLPLGAKVGSSSVLRQSQLKLIRPDLTIVDIRGTIGERLVLVDKRIVDGIIVAACALKRLGLEHRITDYLPWDAMPLQGQLAIVGGLNDFNSRDAVRGLDVRSTYGKVTLVGAGPGDPGLITVKAVQALSKSDCVFYDFLADPRLLKYAPQAEHIYVGKRKGEHSMPQGELSKLLREKAVLGKNIVRLKGGDPLIFGRGLEEINYLQEYHIPVDVIPGVSSATGIPASLKVPLTARGLSSSVSFVSAHEGGEHEVPSTINIPDTGTIVFLMGLTKINAIVHALRQKGWSANTPMMIVAQGTCDDERIVAGNIDTIEGLAMQAELQQPALIIVGKTLEFYKEHVKPTILYCGTQAHLYKNRGRLIEFPMIEIQPKDFDEQILKDADIVLCTSIYAVAYGIKRAIDKGISFESKKFAVIGWETYNALKGLGITADIVPVDEDAPGLFAQMTRKYSLKDKRIVFPRSSLSNPFLKTVLTALGADVKEIVVYENIKPKSRPLPNEPIDEVIFTSPSTVRNFIESYGKIPLSWRILAKGQLTLKTLKEFGYPYATSLS